MSYARAQFISSPRKNCPRALPGKRAKDTRLRILGAVVPFRGRPAGGMRQAGASVTVVPALLIAVGIGMFLAWLLWFVGVR